MASNTTPFHGKVARVEKGEVRMDFTDGWQVDVVSENADTSKQGQNWALNITGFASWSGSF